MGFTRNISAGGTLLGGLLQRLGLPLSLVSPLLAHADSVSKAGLRLGLVAPGELGSIVERHTADSLLFALARPPRLGERWVDAGSGAGFPGLVLACAYPEARFTLIEPHARKAGFLELATVELGMPNVDIFPGRIEEFSGGADVAVARAFREPADALAALLSILRPGGVAIVAAGANAPVPPGARLVRAEATGAVDSPGLLFMMTRES